MNEQKVAFLVELGDFKDQDKTPEEARTLGYLKKIEAVLAGFKGPRYHVIGNHDTDSLSKAAFLSVVENTGDRAQDAPATRSCTAASGSSRSMPTTRPTAATTSAATSTGATATSTGRRLPGCRRRSRPRASRSSSWCTSNSTAPAPTT